MFDALSDRLERISTRLRGKGRISEADLDEALGEIRTALLEADVELSVARRSATASASGSARGALGASRRASR
jgi:signal recognition particle GTPase